MCLEYSPSGEASASPWRFSWRPGAAGALYVALTAAASLREFYPRCLVLPLRGSDTYLAFVPQLEALSELLTHSILAPSWWCPGPLMLWALLTLSGYVLSVPSTFSLRRSRWSIPSHYRPSRAVSLLTVSVFGGRSLLRRVSPHQLGSIGALGDLRWLHIYRRTPDLVSLRHFAVGRWSSGRCFILFLRDVP